MLLFKDDHTDAMAALGENRQAADRERAAGEA